LDPGIGSVPVGRAPRIDPTFLERDNDTPYSIQWNFNVQHQLDNGLFFELGWLANMGHHLFGASNINQVYPTTVDPTATNIQALRPYPQYGAVNPYLAIGNSNYQALVFKVEKRYASGLSFVSNYTWAKFLDDRGRSDWYNRQNDKGLSGNHLEHRFIFAGSYELPVGHGRQWLRSGPLAWVLGGWDVAPQITVESGVTLTPTASGVNCLCFNVGAIRPNRVDGTDTKGDKTLQSWFNLGAFENQGTNVRGTAAFGNTSRGAIIGPGLWNVDLSLSKNVVIKERYRINIRGEFFNFFNHANFGNPSTTIFPAGAPGTTNVITSAREPRRIQLGLRFLW
jgi:hypothetical protein